MPARPAPTDARVAPATPLLRRAETDPAVRWRAAAERVRSWPFQWRTGTFVGLLAMQRLQEQALTQRYGASGGHVAGALPEDGSLGPDGPLESHLRRRGHVDWTALTLAVRTAGSFTASMAVARHALGADPLAWQLLLFVHVPGPLPGWLLEQTAGYGARRLEQLAGSRPEGALVTTGEAALEAAAQVGGTRPSGRPPLVNAAQYLPYVVPVSNWAALRAQAIALESRARVGDVVDDRARQARGLLGAVLGTSFQLPMRRVAAGDAEAYAEVRAAPAETIRDGSIVERLPREVTYAPAFALATWQALARAIHPAWQDPSGWATCCVQTPAVALLLLQHWTREPPVWWTPAQAAPLLRAPSREVRVAATACLARIQAARSSAKPGRPGTDVGADAPARAMARVTHAGAALPEGVDRSRRAAPASR